MITPIVLHSNTQHADAIAQYWPNGRLFNAKFDPSTNMRKLINGLAKEHSRAESYLKALQDEFIPDNAGVFLDDWERVLAIPDNCFDGTGDNATRLRDVLVKLASLGVQTKDDFEELANKFDITATVIAGNDYYTSPGFPFAVTEEESRYYIVVEFSSGATGFPLTFPYTFVGEDSTIVECLFSALKPANCDVLFQQV